MFFWSFDMHLFAYRLQNYTNSAKTSWKYAYLIYYPEIEKEFINHATFTVCYNYVCINEATVFNAFFVIQLS